MAARVAAAVAVALAATACDVQPAPADRDTALPDEPFPRIFRSVLDGRPRVATARLGESLWAAWDVEQGALLRLWSEGVELDGAVYTGRHGPEPTGRGAAWLAPAYAAPWRVHRGASVLEPRVRYRGHSVGPEGPTFHYLLSVPAAAGADGGSVALALRERARRVVAADGVPGFERVYEWTGDRALRVSLDLSLGALEQSDVETDGELALRPTFDAGLRSGRLSLRNDGPTRLVLWLRGPPGLPRPAPEAPERPRGQALVEQNDCLVCHGLDHGTVGPSLRDVSARYREPDVASLARKVIEGGGGVWGEARMTPHDGLAVDDAQAMVHWILGLEHPAEPVEPEPLPSRGFFSGWGDFFAAVARRWTPRNSPGDGLPLDAVHPSFVVEDLRPADFQPRVGGLDFLSDGRLAVATWDRNGAVYLLDGVTDGGPVSVRRIAEGLAEPLGLVVVDDVIHVLQKPELTRLHDLDGDGAIDRYETLSRPWTMTTNFHEFAFGLAYRAPFFYASLATAILPGGASAPDQAPHRGRVVRVDGRDGSLAFPASGLRTPNGVGFGPRGLLYVTDNQGDWLPASKVVALDPDGPERFFGSRAVLGEAAEGLAVTPPVVWLPQHEIGNSPTQPLPIDIAPWTGQLLVADVTHGGIKRVFVEEVAGLVQGAVFRFSQGFEAGLNRMVWGPDGALYVGGIGSDGNWGQVGKLRYGLQRLRHTGAPVFEMRALRLTGEGVEIELTEPAAVGAGDAAAAYELEQWRYQPSPAYGGPKLDREALPVEAVDWSADRRRVRLAVSGIAAGRVVYVRLARDRFRSEGGASLWATEAWYTVNALPGGAP